MGPFGPTVDAVLVGTGFVFGGEYISFVGVVAGKFGFFFNDGDFPVVDVSGGGDGALSVKGLDFGVSSQVMLAGVFEFSAKEDSVEGLGHTFAFSESEIQALGREHVVSFLDFEILDFSGREFQIRKGLVSTSAVSEIEEHPGTIEIVGFFINRSVLSHIRSVGRSDISTGVIVRGSE